MHNQQRILCNMIGDRIQLALIKKYGKDAGEIGDFTVTESNHPISSRSLPEKSLPL